MQDSEDQSKNQEKKTSKSQDTEKKPKEPLTEKVVVGMSGGIDSAVAAYLVKKQGYECVGIGIDFFAKGMERVAKTCFPHFYIPDLNVVKNICESLEIPFYAVNAHNEFENEILDIMISNKLLGKEHALDVELTRLMFRILEAKCRLLGGIRIASGHYIRMHREKRNDSTSLNRTNVPETDQCYLMSQVDCEVFENLITPLSELRKDDVKRLGETLGIQTKEMIGKCSKDERHAALAEMVDILVAKNLRRDGIIMHHRTDRHLGDHKGVNHFYVGQDNIQSSFHLHVIDKDLAVLGIDFSKALVFLGDPENVRHKSCNIHQLNFSKGTDFTKSLGCFVQVNDVPQLLSAQVYFKNNGSANVVFENELEDLNRGYLISMFSSSKAGGKLIGSGFVNYIGDFERIHRGEMAEDEELVKRREDEDRKRIKKDFMF